MKHLMSIALLVALLVAGCQSPNDVELKQDDAEVLLDVAALAPGDTSLGGSSVDSTALLPSDEVRFGGLMLVNKITFDDGTVVRTAAYSTMVLADRQRPLQIGGKVFGYYGINLNGGPGILPTVNGLSMLRVAHRLRVAGSPVNWGFEYIRDLTGVYQPNTTYRWIATPDSVGAINVSVTSPDDLTVLSPAGGSRVFRDRDLLMRWTGRGPIFIVVSTVDPVSKRTRPVLKLTPLVNRGGAMLGAKVLRALPRERYFVFTFVLANRQESVVVNQYAGRILAQAASVYNCYVELW